MLATNHTAIDALYLITCLNNQSIPRPLFTIEGVDIVFSLAYSKCGSQLARGEGQEVVVCDPVSGFELHRFQGHTDGIGSVSFNPNGAQVASGTEDQTVRIWNVETGVCEWTVRGHDSAVMSVSWSPDGTRLTSGSRDETVRIWEVATGKELSQLNVGYAPFSLAPFSLDLVCGFQSDLWKSQI